MLNTIASRSEFRARMQRWSEDTSSEELRSFATEILKFNKRRPHRRGDSRLELPTDLGQLRGISAMLRQQMADLVNVDISFIPPAVPSSKQVYIDGKLFEPAPTARVTGNSRLEYATLDHDKPGAIRTVTAMLCSIYPITFSIASQQYTKTFLVVRNYKPLAVPESMQVSELLPSPESPHTHISAQELLEEPFFLRLKFLESDPSKDETVIVAENVIAHVAQLDCKMGQSQGIISISLDIVRAGLSSQPLLTPIA